MPRKIIRLLKPFVEFFRKEETAGVPVKKTKAQLPSLSADEQFAVDHRVNEHAPYDIGARVYALWGREYYAAQVSA